MYIDPMIGIVRYEEHVREAEERIARLRALEERRGSATKPRPTRAVRGLRRLLPRHAS